MSIGIDYGRGLTNIDHKTGIRYGVIHQNEVLQAWADSSEPDMGPPCCPICGEEAMDYEHDRHSKYEIAENSCEDYACTDCKYVFDSSEAYPDEVDSFYLDDGEYGAQSDSYGDIFITKSPYYTRCAFASPCAPGAGYCMDQREEGIKSYCFGHDFFDNGKAPYRVFRVENDEEVFPEEIK